MTYNAFLLLDVHTPPSGFCNDDLGNYSEMRHMYEYNLYASGYQNQSRGLKKWLGDSPLLPRQL